MGFDAARPWEGGHPATLDPGPGCGDPIVGLACPEATAARAMKIPVDAIRGRHGDRRVMASTGECTNGRACRGSWHWARCHGRSVTSTTQRIAAHMQLRAHAGDPRPRPAEFAVTFAPQREAALYRLGPKEAKKAVDRLGDALMRELGGVDWTAKFHAAQSQLTGKGRKRYETTDLKRRMHTHYLVHNWVGLNKTEPILYRTLRKRQKFRAAIEALGFDDPMDWLEAKQHEASRHNDEINARDDLSEDEKIRHYRDPHMWEVKGSGEQRYIELPRVHALTLPGSRFEGMDVQFIGLVSTPEEFTEDPQDLVSIHGTGYKHTLRGKIDYLTHHDAWVGRGHRVRYGGALSYRRLRRDVAAKKRALVTCKCGRCKMAHPVRWDGAGVDWESEDHTPTPAFETVRAFAFWDARDGRTWHDAQDRNRVVFVDKNGGPAWIEGEDARIHPHPPLPTLEAELDRLREVHPDLATPDWYEFASQEHYFRSALRLVQDMDDVKKEIAKM